MTSYELILIQSIFPHIRKDGVYTAIYGVYAGNGNPMYGLGQPYLYMLQYGMSKQAGSSVQVRNEGIRSEQLAVCMWELRK
jgi:hypothetical protein